MDYKQKYLICNSCKNLENKICKLCGCYMPIKVAIPFATCPINKWREHEKIRSV